MDVPNESNDFLHLLCSFFTFRNKIMPEKVSRLCYWNKIVFLKKAGPGIASYEKNHIFSD